MPWFAYVAGAAAIGWVLKGSGEVIESSAKLGRVVVIGGVVYVAYQVVKK